ncbi:hypothetical protein V8C37DRAFT_376001 [Trichoderma ceciliae]
MTQAMARRQQNQDQIQVQVQNQHQHQIQHQHPHQQHLLASPSHHQIYRHSHQQQRQSSAGQFGILTPTPMPSSMPSSMPEDDSSPLRRPAQDHVRYGRHQNAAATAAATAKPYKFGQGRLVIDPPDLRAWRERLFHVDNVIILTHEQFETYFPHIDNVYSHRSTQQYKRKPFISHYWDCRMKGRPPGTPKSDDPSKKKRKRSARERDLCDVKIKITEYFPDAGAEAALDRDVAAAIAAGIAASAVISTGQRFWTIQRVNGNGGNGKGDGVAGPHRHSLERSDEIKKNSVQRLVVMRGRGVKKTHKTPQKRATGAAQATVRTHSKETDLKLFAACFCPYSQRVWIALEAKGQPYQYIESDPFNRFALTALFEASPRGRVPTILQGDWACSESAVILEYLEDMYPDIPLLPSDPHLRANCRLWIDHINTGIVPIFFSLLRLISPSSTSSPSSQPTINSSTTAAASSSSTSSSTTTAITSSLSHLQTSLTPLVCAADKQGPYFLGSSLSLVDIHLAPLALRLSRILRHRHPSSLMASDPGSRWNRWLDALERNPHIMATTSTDDFYLDTADLLIQTPDVGS